ncbi:MAG TPA: hypothetical protein DEW46_06850, partial [Verrucomicrobia bacterium]|nr:hypothetical protein [Verrucomicrobiota bacterium]
IELIELIEIEIEIEIEIGIDSCSGWRFAFMDRLNFAAELCQHRNNTVGCGIRFLTSESQPIGA